MVNEKLATLHISSNPCLVEALFKVENKDISITYAENFWSTNITDNKRSIIKLYLRNQLRKATNPYLSKDKIIYE